MLTRSIARLYSRVSEAYKAHPSDLLALALVHLARSYGHALNGRHDAAARSMAISLDYFTQGS